METLVRGAGDRLEVPLVQANLFAAKRAHAVQEQRSPVALAERSERGD